MAEAINIDVRQAVQSLKEVTYGTEPYEFSRAVSRAINKTSLLGRTEARKAVKSVYTVAQRYLGGVEVQKAYPNKLIGGVGASTKPLPMDAFSVKFSFSGSSITSISKRGVSKTKLSARGAKKMFGGGVMLEAVKGRVENIPYAFMIPTLTSRVFARGLYKGGGGSWGFVPRHKRLPNDAGNDSVTPMASATIWAEVVNPKSQQRIYDKINGPFVDNLQHEVDNILKGITL